MKVESGIEEQKGGEEMVGGGGGGVELKKKKRTYRKGSETNKIKEKVQNERGTKKREAEKGNKRRRDGLAVVSR